MALLTAFSVSVCIFCVITALFYKKAFDKDQIKNRLDILADEKKTGFLFDDELSKSFTERVIKPLIHKLTQMISMVIPIKSFGKQGAEKQKAMLQQAGWTISVEEYAVVQLVLMAVCGVIGVVAGILIKTDAMRIVLYGIGGIFGAYTVLRFICTSTATKRKKSMEAQLPDMLDLLCVSVSAGLGFERAMLHIVETMEGPLIDEFAVAYREMSMGRSRKDALTLLGERCGVEDLISVTGALVQAGQLGIPISNVLQSQSAALRRARRSRVQEKAAKVSTKILIPMVAFIFPVLIIVLMGPSIITIMGEF